jgi:xanthine dehydrogenase YagR molybdenum-binding subunit
LGEGCHFPASHAEVVSIDGSAAEKLPGVKGVWKDEAAIGKEVQYVGQIVAAVAATTEEIATEAATLVKVEYKPLEHQVVDSNPEFSKGNPAKKDTGNVDEAFGKADVTHTGNYGCPVITHCCLEPHGQVSEIRDGEMSVWPSTQNVSGYADRGLSDAAGVPQNKINVDCQFMGGGFGSKVQSRKMGHDLGATRQANWQARQAAPGARPGVDDRRQQAVRFQQNQSRRD